MSAALINVNTPGILLLTKRGRASINAPLSLRPLTINKPLGPSPRHPGHGRCIDGAPCSPQSTCSTFEFWR